MKPDEFWSLTWGEFWRMVRGHNKRVDYENKRGWTYTAQIMALNWNLSDQRETKRPDDFMPDKYKEDREKEPTSDPESFKKRVEHSKRFNKGAKKEVL